MYGSPWTLLVSLSSSVTVGYIGFQAMLLMHKVTFTIRKCFFYANVLLIKRVFDNAKHRLCVI